MARFLYHVKNENLRSNQGVFYGKGFTDNEMEGIVWSIKSYLITMARRSTYQSHGGIALYKPVRIDPHKRKLDDDGRDYIDLKGEEYDGMHDEDSTLTDTDEDDFGIRRQTEDWNIELLQPKERIILARTSKDYDPKDKYWRYRLVVEALERTVLLTDDDSECVQPDASKNAQRPLTPKSLHEYARDIYDPLKYVETADLEASMAAEADTSEFASSDTIIPTEESLKFFREQQGFLDNLDYQREDHKLACQVLRIENPRVPRMRSMNRSAVLKFWQPVAIARILEIRQIPFLRGAILGDSVGLGKTWETIAIMLKIWEDYNQSVINSKQQNRPIPAGRPFLIIVPPGLISQWYSEINRVTDKLRVYIYYGQGRPVQGMRTIASRLRKTDTIFNGSPINARTVIITSYQTFAHRHGPTAVRAWYSEATIELCPDEIPCPPAKFPFSLTGCFGDVILDEAHILRNPETSQSRAVQWLEADFHLLVTATPIYNSRKDILGYVPLLFQPPGSWSKADQDYFKVWRGRIFDIPLGHPARHLCCTEHAVKEHVSADWILPSVTGNRLRLIFSHLMIRRTLFSHMPFDSPNIIGDDIPPTQRKICRVEYNKNEKAMFEEVSPPLYRGLIMQSPIDPQRYIWNMRKFRRLELLMSWLGFHYTHHSYYASDIPLACKKLYEGTLGAKLADAITSQTLKEKLSKSAAGPKESETVHEGTRNGTRDSRTRILEALLRGSPKMRAMLPLIRDQVILHDEKAIVWTQVPAEQIYVAAVLREANMDAEVLHGSLSRDERAALLYKFTEIPDKCMVLVCNYMLNTAGLNLQSLCRNVHLFSVGLSKSLVNQAIGRVSRIGQKRPVFVYDYRIKGEFDDTLANLSARKSIPGIIAELSRDFDIKMGNDGAFAVTGWVIRHRVLHHLVPGEQIQKGDITDGMRIIKKLMSRLEDTTRGLRY
ncbi:putative DNA repair helicase rad5,16 [Aspergillus ibericus CBS 121593]|uniref:Putative DNA repair helicase rad5,16 n=1 Tax=Aspergillus ibericus CBS 121593 TaxID=1448316 RepID=A0A395H0F7_9EURO|nr:putative DNA repair helicase rad5,16 [Aspergillus ibericus CBS 121593]RAL01276.1 putative DNA repair helicase rad5,16 [Aspergillus ibericus CBS 121593]